MQVNLPLHLTSRNGGNERACAIMQGTETRSLKCAQHVRLIERCGDHPKIPVCALRADITYSAHREIVRPASAQHTVSRSCRSRRASLVRLPTSLRAALGTAQDIEGRGCIREVCARSDYGRLISVQH